MKLMDIVQMDLIRIVLETDDTNVVIRELVQALEDAGAIDDCELICDMLRRSEKHYGTWAGLGGQMALPHLRTSHVDRLWLAIGVSQAGIDWNALDGELVHVIFLFLMPPRSAPHMRWLEQFGRVMIRESSFFDFLKQCSNPDDVYCLFQEAEEMLRDANAG